MSISVHDGEGGSKIVNNFLNTSWSEGLLMVVSKRWLEFYLEIKSLYPLLTSIEPPFYLSLTSF